MVECVFESVPTVGQRQGAFTVPCSATPFLTVPSTIPVTLRYALPSDMVDIEVDFFNASLDEDLTEMAKGIIPDFFDLEVAVAREEAHGHNLGIINPVECGIRNFSIGPRVRLLDKYFKCGELLCWLVTKCPLYTWGPHEVLDHATLCHYGGESAHELTWEGMPRWREEFNVEGYWTRHSLPDMPPNLSRIVQECINAIMQAEEDKRHRRGYASNNLQGADCMTHPFPIAMASWENMVPYQDRRTKRQTGRDFGPERGDDYSWIALDDIGLMCAETGEMPTCINPQHSVEQLQQILTNTKPFIKLFKYLSHVTDTYYFSGPI